MTQNALAVLTKGNMALSEIDRQMLAEMGQEEAAFDFVPTRLKIAPGGTNVFQTGDGDVMKDFTAIVLMSQKARAYWPGSGNGLPPICASPDGAHGFFVPDPPDDQFQAAAGTPNPHPGIILLSEKEPLPEFFHCARCPMAQWGSNHQRNNSRAQACKSLRRLAVMVDGWTSPALLTLPPSSIKLWDSYCSTLARTGKPYFAVRTQFSLENAKSAQGDPYSVISVKTAGDLSDDEKVAVLEVRRQYAAMIKDLPIDAAEYETRESNEEGEMIPF